MHYFCSNKGIKLQDCRNCFKFKTAAYLSFGCWVVVLCLQVKSWYHWQEKWNFILYNNLEFQISLSIHLKISSLLTWWNSCLYCISFVFVNFIIIYMAYGKIPQSDLSQTMVLWPFSLNLDLKVNLLIFESPCSRYMTKSCQICNVLCLLS